MAGAPGKGRNLCVKNRVVALISLIGASFVAFVAMLACRPAAASASGNFAVNQNDTYRVAQENGPGSINRTDGRWDLYGADLGHMFTFNGGLAMVFGESFGGPASNPFFSVPHGDWRSNTMAAINPPSAPPTRGLMFNGRFGNPAGMVTDLPNHAEELLSSLKTAGKEQTVIPTYGVSVGNRMYLHYMSVREFDQPGHWTLNYSGIAYSDNGGQSWTKSNLRWPGDSNFGQVAIVHQGGFLYLYGSPAGRYGSLELARVPDQQALNLDAYQYWNGISWTQNNPAAAVPIVQGPVGELSVQYNSYYRKWLMMYLVDPTSQVVLRSSDSLTGPWSPPQVVADGSKYPQLYAPYITPLWNNQKDIYFTMSMYGPYQVSLMHTSLNVLAPGASPPAGTSPTPITPSTTASHTTYPFAHGAGSASNKAGL